MRVTCGNREYYYYVHARGNRLENVEKIILSSMNNELKWRGRVEVGNVGGFEGTTVQLTDAERNKSDIKE